MRLIYTCLYCFLTILVNAQGYHFHWVSSIENSAYGNAVDTDNSGNVFVSGWFMGTNDFNPGTGIDTLVSNGAKDVYVQKLGPSGDFIWAVSLGGVGQEEAYSLTLDSAGNVIVSGYFSSTTDFDPGSGVHSVTPNGGKDIFVLKLDANGNFLWVYTIGGNGHDIAYDCITDVNGEVYVTGHFSSSVEFDSGAGSSLITSNGMGDVFILKLQQSGDFVWVKTMGGGTQDRSYKIVLDTNTNIYIAGSYSGTVDFDPGTGVYSLTSSGADLDIFVHKLDLNGDFVWVRSMGGGDPETAWGLVTDINGNVIVTGYFSDVADFDPGTGTNFITSNGNRDIFIQKFDTNGNSVWVKTIGGSELDQGYSIDCDNTGNIFLTGDYRGTVDFDSGSGVDNLTSVNQNPDIFILKLLPNGDYEWAKSIGGTGVDFGRGLAIDHLGSLLCTGRFSGTADFDPSLNIYNLWSSQGQFILKLGDCLPIAVIDVHQTCSPFTWIDGNTYVTSNNTATYTLTNAAGCDSVVTLDLTVNAVNTNYTTTNGTIAADAIGATYQWIDCNTNATITGETGQTYTPITNGSYALIVTENNCTDTSSCVSIQNVGIDNQNLLEGVKLYPNPTKNDFTIELGNLKGVDVAVYNVRGQLLYHQETINTPQHLIKLNYPAGMYFVEVAAEGKIQRFKLIKE